MSEESIKTFENIIVPINQIDGIWDEVKDEIVRTNDEVLNEKDVKEYLKDGSYTLWLVKEINSNTIVAVFTTEFAYYPRNKTCRVVTLAGKRLHEWVDSKLHDLEIWAIEQGCSHMDMYARRGWKKILTEYKEDCVLLRKKL